MLKNKTHYLIFILSAIFLLLGALMHPLDLEIEAVGFLGAELLNSGGSLYTDFWTMYAPGAFYFNKLLLNIGLDSLFDFRIVYLFFEAILVFYIFIYSRSFFDKFKSSLLALTSAVLISSVNLYSQPVLIALCFAFAGAYVLFLYFKDPQVKYLIYSGILIGLTAVFRHDMGGYLYGFEFQAVFFASLSHPLAQKLPRMKKIKYGLKNAFIYTGAIAVVLPIAIYFFATIPFDLLWENLFINPFSHFRTYQNIPFSELFVYDFEGLSSFAKLNHIWQKSIFFVPVIIFLSSVLSIIYRVKTKKLILNGQQFWREMTLFNLGMNLYNHAMIKSDFTHIIPPLIISLILGLLFIRNHFSGKTKLFALSIFGIILVFFPIFDKYEQLRNNYVIGLLNLNRHNNLHINANEANYDYQYEYREIIATIISDSSEYLYSGVENHDNFKSNDNMIYYLTQKKSPSKYYELQPGVLYDSLVQSHIITSLEKHNVHTILLKRDDKELDKQEIKIENELNELNILDDYIRSNYSVQKQYHKYLLLSRNIRY